jgi:ABC-type lipoprotein release transport system permease subunit
MFPIAHVDRGLGTTIERWKMLRGRPAQPGRVDEATASFLLAEQLGLEVGDTVRLRFTKATSFPSVAAALLGGFASRLRDADGAEPVIEELADGPLVTFKIVGIEASPAEFPPLGPDLAPPLHLTPAFYRTYRGQLVDSPLSYVRLKRGASDLPSFQAAVDRLAGSAQTSFIFARPNQTAEVQRAIRVEAFAARVVAGITGFALFAVVAQALSRQAMLDAAEHRVLRALGMTPAQLVLLSVGRGAVVAVVGAAVAVLVAWALSPLSPIGLARTAEVDPGMAFDGAVLGVGALVLLVAVAVMTLVAAARAARLSSATGRGAGEDDRGSRFVAALNRTHLSPTAAVGVTFALERGRGGASVPVRTTMFGVAVVVALLTATLSFGGSLDRLLDTPRLYGWNWDIKSGAPGLPDVLGTTLRSPLTTDPAVAALSLGTVTQVELDRQRVDVLALEQLKREVVPTVVEGHAPRRGSDVLLGSKTLDDLDKEIGDVVTARLGLRSARLTIVGRGVFPDFGDAGQLGRGALMTFSGLRALLPGAQRNVFFARFRPDVDAAAAFTRVRAALDPVPTRPAQRPGDLVSVARVDRLPRLLAGVLALLAAATLVHTLLTSVRRRRRDLAILKTIGFMRRQVSFAVVWQATTLAAVALVIGMPLGVAAGRWVWSLFTTGLGVTAPPVVHPLPLVIIALATLAVANVIAAIPAWLAGRGRSAVALRTE